MAWRRADPVLVAAMAGGLLMRTWGASYGLPHVYNPDESAILMRALALAQTGVNPGNFVYPSFYFYLLAAVMGGLYVSLAAAGRVDSLRDFEALFWSDPTPFYLTARWLSAVAGTATILVVYAVGRRIGGRAVARVAAVCLAASYFPIRDAHFVKHDVLVTLLVAASVLAALVAWHRRLDSPARASNRPFVVAAALAGAAFATHYYAAFAILPVVVAVLLARSEAHPHAPAARTIIGMAADRRLWLVLATFVATFACLSPFVLLDWPTALRDIAQNRAIVIDRAHQTFGAFGPGLEHLRLMATQGAGVPYLVAGVAGFGLLVYRDPRGAAIVVSFPVVFFAFISNSWPFGRSENPLYPFLAIGAGITIEAVSRGLTSRHDGRRRSNFYPVAAAVLTMACIAQPLWSATLMNRLMGRDDTRTLARLRLAQILSDGEGVAVEVYSVPLSPTRDWLEATLIATRGSVANAGYRFRAQLARRDYPAPAYRLFYIGEGGLDQDKQYLPPGVLAAPGGWSAARARGVRFVVLKRLSLDEPNALRESLSRDARLIETISPFRDSVSKGRAQMPDFDIPPALDVERPGPILEIWELT